MKFLPFVSPEAYEELARTADCGLVALKPGITSIPSKIAWFLGRGLPVVAVLPGGAAAELVLRSGGGMRVEAGADAHLAFCIEWLATHPEQRWRMGELGRAYAGRELSRGKAIDQWDALLRGLT